MHVAIESPTPITEARRLLANVMARDALGGLSHHLETVRFCIPGPRRCDLHVRLADGTTLDCEAKADNMADALERATHAMRVKVLRALGLPLPPRTWPSDSPMAERRSL
jgi:hypothetical protein